jgi:protein TonB
MSQPERISSRRPSYGIAAVVIVLHVLAVAGLIRAFAPDFAAEVAGNVTAAFNVPLPPPPTPPPEPPPGKPDDTPQGAAAPEGRKANPREVSAPRPKLVVTRKTAPPVPGKGADDSSGAGDKGDGTGAGGQGNGTGSGNGGNGTGGGMVSPPVKVAGDINSARDYPKASRDLRVGTDVVVALTVGTDGRVKGCRVVRGSADPQAGPITCRLATERFRFRPATDAAGNAVQAVFGWRQRWFYTDNK